MFNVIENKIKEYEELLAKAKALEEKMIYDGKEYKRISLMIAGIERFLNGETVETMDHFFFCDRDEKIVRESILESYKEDNYENWFVHEELKGEPVYRIIPYFDEEDKIESYGFFSDYYGINMILDKNELDEYMGVTKCLELEIQDLSNTLKEIKIHLAEVTLKFLECQEQANK